ncbi:MAG: molybdenum cofactor biosynthesis protein MoaE [Sphingomonadaceae bacterium]|nr:molybdenum cofactor biosynthesis protein MoaE [Sphingomonadaceae bacterium]
MKPDVRVQADAFDSGVELAALEQRGAGGIASFIGIVRGDGGLEALELEHYPAMTEQALGGVAAEAARRWPLLALTVIHRHGRLVPGDRIVFVGAAAAHRGEAIAATNFVIDWLKTDAPFWKREIFGDGRSQWVEARAADDAARVKWDS